MGQSRSKLHSQRQHVTPVGLYPKCAWPSKTIKKLITYDKLGPIYRGVEEPVDGAELDECPICFLNYPGLNRTICCRQEICTECFLQLKPSPHTAAPCPFCIQPDYAVSYSGPKTPAERLLEREEMRKIKEAQRRRRMEDILRDHHDRSTTGTDVEAFSFDDGSESCSLRCDSPRDLQDTKEFEALIAANNMTPVDVEELMIAEAIRLSLSHHR